MGLKKAQELSEAQLKAWEYVIDKLNDLELRVNELEEKK